jgi:cell division septation protein DedD
LSHHTEDDGFHEIQLNGKQLVFVFMAVTVVSVVIFLCGVLVGRGVPGERALAQGSDTAAELKELALDPAKPVIPPTVRPGSDPTLAPPPTPPEGEQSKGRSAELPTAAAAAGTAGGPGAAGGNDARLKADSKADEKKPAADSARTAAAESKAAAAAPRAAAPRDAAASSEPIASPKDVRDARAAVDASTQDWVVQVAAVKKRNEADSIAKRLGGKGYTTFVLAEGSRVFRVRVGGYKTKREAEVVAAKLRKEERINPWVTQRQAP